MRRVLQDARDAFEDARNWEREAFTTWLAARMASGDIRRDLFDRAWRELQRAAEADDRGRMLVEFARPGGLAGFAKSTSREE